MQKNKKAGQARPFTTALLHASTSVVMAKRFSIPERQPEVFRFVAHILAPIG